MSLKLAAFVATVLSVGGYLNYELAREAERAVKIAADSARIAQEFADENRDLALQLRDCQEFQNKFKEDTR